MSSAAIRWAHRPSDDLAGMAVYLASDEAAWTSGGILRGRRRLYRRVDCADQSLASASGHAKALDQTSHPACGTAIDPRRSSDTRGAMSSNDPLILFYTTFFGKPVDIASIHCEGRWTLDKRRFPRRQRSSFIFRTFANSATPTNTPANIGWPGRWKVAENYNASPIRMS